MTRPSPPEGGGTAPWLSWARSLQAIAQAGLTYGRDDYDRERYVEVQRLAAEIAAAGSGDDVEQITHLFAGQRGYPTPKIDVRAAVFLDEQILLVQERDDGRWSLPGGWADVGESAAEAVARETREESGVEVQAIKLIALLERERWNHPPHPEFSYKAFFACRPLGLPAPHPGAETTGAAFFPVGALPPLSLARVTSPEIKLALAHARQPDLPTVFD
jgi:ADP-ribose pyrophosphatase YjhB (NUDIX family)